jgi:uncharacterized protein
MPRLFGQQAALDGAERPAQCETIVTQTSAGQRPVPFDAFKLAAGGDSLVGTVDAKQMPRVADRVAGNDGAASVAWRIDGGQDESGRPALTVNVDGSVPLVCQRCLQPFDFRVDQHTRLLLARNEAQLASLDAEEPEVVLASSALDARSLVEDELLLSLPFAPRHPDGECDPAVVAMAVEPQSDKASPFARLSALKNGNE